MKLNIQLIFFQNPFGDTPQGKLLTQMQGMIAEYEHTQIVERMRRDRLEKAHCSEFISWAYTCYGYRYPNLMALTTTPQIDVSRTWQLKRLELAHTAVDYQLGADDER